MSMVTSCHQFLPFSFEDSLDSTHPFECDFVIPSGATIKKITISVKSLAYRAYSSGAEYKSKWNEATGKLSWLSSLDSISVSLAKTYYSQYLEKSLTTSQNGSHSHTYTKATGTTTSTENTNSTGAHTHTYTIPSGLLTDVSAKNIKLSEMSHTHDIDISHGHNLVYGIHEGTFPTDVKIYYDNGDGYDSGETLGTFTKITDKVLYNGDNIQKFTGTGWKAIKFTSSTLGRLRVQLMVELRVDTTA